MLTKKSFLAEMTPLLLILFIDGMGLGLVFPILNNLIVDQHSAFAASLSVNARDFIYGAIVSVFMLCWFFGAPFLGDLSDAIGRKKALMICLIGASLGYFISALGITAGSMTFLIIGRMIAGFTSGSQPIAQAAIIDLSEPKHKTRNISFILLSLSLGFILGPLIGGLLSNNHLVSWFNYSLPLYFAGAISLINALLLYFIFAETFTQVKTVQLKLHRAIEIFQSAFAHKTIRDLSIIFLVMVFGWSSYYTFISMFLLKKFHLSNFDITLFMAVMGVGFGIGNGFLADFLAQKFKLQVIVITTILMSSVGILITALATNVLYAWILIIPVAAFLSVAYAVVLTIFSNQVDADSQGWIMGITGAIMALTFGLNSLLLSLLASIDIDLPLYISAAGLMISGLLMTVFKSNGKLVHSL